MTMKNKEAIQQLKLTLDYCMRADPDAYNEIEAIQHAIKCVELMPEVVDDVEYLLVCMDEGYKTRDIKPIILESLKDRLNKAKELIEWEYLAET